MNQAEKNTQEPSPKDLELRERYAEILANYQKNIIDTAGLQTEIIKGVRQGESIYSLFLKAVKAISIMSNSAVIYDQICADLPVIYGVGLREEEPLANEIAEVRRRLSLLEEAAGKETEPDARARLEAAAKAHRLRIRFLEELSAQKEAEAQ